MITVNCFKKHIDWIKIWSGRWSLHFDSQQGYWWTKNKNIAKKPAYPTVIYFCENGITDCWVRAHDKDGLGSRLCNLAIQDPAYIISLAKGLVQQGKKVAAFRVAHDPAQFGGKEYREFWKTYSDYFIYHISVKYIVDYLSEKELKRYLPRLEAARLTAESVTRDAETYWEAVAAHVAEQTSYTKEMILSTTREEFTSFLQGKKLPSKTSLANRYKKSSLVMDTTGYAIFTGKQVEQMRNSMLANANADVISGQTAYPGTVTGIVKIIYNPLKEAAKFNPGDILVTGMTRPEFLPLIHTSAAFVTDAGGILSHAAITARELRKPCVTGTKIATKVLKDGDRVEVDADEGIIRRIND